MRLLFRDVFGNLKKTIVKDIYSGDQVIGQIKFYPQWRKYCFFPNSQTLWDSSCLEEVRRELLIMNDQRKLELAERRKI